MQLLQHSTQVDFQVLNQFQTCINIVSNAPSVFRLGSYVYKEEGFFCIPHSTEAAAVKFKEKVDEIQATASPAVSDTDEAVRNENKVDDSSKEEEKLCIKNPIPETEEEAPNVFTVVICWFGLACSAIVAICK